MIKIKTAAENDISTIENILTDALAWKDIDVIGMSLWSNDSIQWKHLSTTFKASDFYIAYLDGVPAACVAVSDHDPEFWADIPKGESLFINKLAVMRFAAKQGLADALISHVKSVCADKNISALRLICHSHIPKLRSVYERNGFVCVNEKILYEKYHTAFYKCDIYDERR